MTISDTLRAELSVTNESAGDLVFETCLHTYFAVGDIAAVRLAGLKGVRYLDQLSGSRRCTDTDDAIRIGGEVDRIYLDTAHAVKIHDEKLRRTVRVDKSGSASVEAGRKTRSNHVFVRSGVAECLRERGCVC